MKAELPLKRMFLRIGIAVAFLLFFTGLSCAQLPDSLLVPQVMNGTIDASTLNGTAFPEILPPILSIDRVELENVTCTVYGKVVPGTENTSITMLRWSWGDNSTLEEHLFPNSHDYQIPGRYTLTITAGQSDGQYRSASVTIDISPPVIPETPNGTVPGPLSMLPAGPGIAPAPPTLTLLEPVVNRMNVTLNGNLDPGGPGVNISYIEVNWNDSASSHYPDLPATHHYRKEGVYTINITAIQSDGQSTSRRISVELQAESPVVHAPVMESPLRENTPVILIILVTAIVVIALAAGIHQIFLRKHHTTSLPDIPKALSVQEDLYNQAKKRGDLVTAAASAHMCAQMCRTHAENNVGTREIYVRMAEKWEKIARSTAKVAAENHIVSGRATALHPVPRKEDLERLCEGTDIRPDVLDAVLNVALEIAREGREGQAVGTSFIVGDTGAVMDHSRQFILNPFQGHDEKSRDIRGKGIRGNLKEFAQLDGAFIVKGDGIVEAAGRNLTADMSRVKIPEGLGSRHSSVAGITMVTRSIGVVVSQSGGQITLFRDGKIFYTILP